MSVEVRDGQRVLVELTAMETPPGRGYVRMRNSAGYECFVPLADIRSVLPDVIEVGDRVGHLRAKSIVGTVDFVAPDGRCAVRWDTSTAGYYPGDRLVLVSKGPKP